MGYKHLTKEQRYTIEALLQTPMSLREIGEVIGVSTGTVSREIRRNCDMRGYHRYRWQLAQKKYERRMKTRRHYLKFTDEMKRTVRRFIIYGQYSPEQICGRFRLKGEEIRIPLDKQAILMFSIPTEGCSFVAPYGVTFTLEIPIKSAQYLTWINDRLTDGNAP